MNDVTLTHHHLSAEWVRDSCGTAIMLSQQDGIQETQTVLVHPFQLRAVCEQFGIVASDENAAKAITTLQRRMVRLRDRIEALADWMVQCSDHQHADLTYETTQLGALRELAGEWCSEFEELESDSTPAPAEFTSAPTAQASLL